MRTKLSWKYIPFTFEVSYQTIFNYTEFQTNTTEDDLIDRSVETSSCVFELAREWCDSKNFIRYILKKKDQQINTTKALTG